MNEREDSIGERQRSQAQAAADMPKLTLTQDPQQADVTDDDATSVMRDTGATTDPTQPLTAAESMIEADLDNPRVHDL